MKLVFTEQSLDSLEQCLRFLINEQGVPIKKAHEIAKKLLERAEGIATNPMLGQVEPHLIHLGMGHRRIVEGNYKIIYRVGDGCVYILDFFDTRQHPRKMKQ
jgi:plasmid stabilization system protein ParE